MKKMSKSNISIIICTLDRPNDIKRFLNSLAFQTLAPKELIIVDASSNCAQNKSLLDDFVKKNNISILHISAPRGLTIQRNIGIKSVGNECNIVSFFDDDIELAPDYLEKIANVFESDYLGKIGGVGGMVQDYETQSNKSRHNHKIANLFLEVLQRVFFITSTKPYSILITGMNVSKCHKAKRTIKVNWLHGCTSYRHDVFKILHYDDNLKGYSMREDVDFSFRVSRRYDLVFVPEARMIHHHSPTARTNEATFGEMDINSWHWFVKKNMKNINLMFFWWGAVGYLLLLLSLSKIERNKNIYLRFRGGLNALRNLLI